MGFEACTWLRDMGRRWLHHRAQEEPPCHALPWPDKAATKEPGLRDEFEFEMD